MAERHYITREQWAQIQATVRRLNRQLTNLNHFVHGIYSHSGSGIAVIEFSLSEELRRGQTVPAVHLPWEDEAEIQDLRVIEKNKLSADLRAPEGTTGFAVKRRIGWVILTLDCDALEPHDGG